ncbi:MAG TPA: hypothetical protein VK153_02565 [Candidatus Paceibacterota bacterium]|nr:hypothetical protein [Candidatus Paceibacterota bacterium]
MNTKLFNVSLLVALGMLVWFVIQRGSLPFQIVRASVALVSILFTFFSVTWNEKSGWKKAVAVILVVLATGSIVFFAITWGFKYYFIETIVLTVVLGVLSFIAISKQKTKIPVN